jgi:hypothetical protein
MWRVKNGEASESAKGICTMRFDARLGRHASLVRLAWKVESQKWGEHVFGASCITYIGVRSLQVP